MPAKVIKLIHTLLVKVSDFLFPPRCVGCSRKNILFCVDCIKKVSNPKIERFKRRNLDRILSYGLYENDYLRSAIIRFKYYGTYGFAQPLGEMLHHLTKIHLTDSRENTLILPIPIARDRRRARGYNQTELLAEDLSKNISVPHLNNILLKSRATRSQTSLAGKERIENVRDSFIVKNHELVRGKKIILVDDILTTGATLSEAARVLKEAGALEVAGLVVAR